MPSVAQIREQIEGLNLEDRIELKVWLDESTSEELVEAGVESESVRIAEQRMADVAAGKSRLIESDEFWKRIQTRQHDQDRVP